MREISLLLNLASPSDLLSKYVFCSDNVSPSVARVNATTSRAARHAPGLRPPSRCRRPSVHGYAPGKLRVGDPSDAAGTHPELEQIWKRRNGDLAKLRRRVGVGEEDQPVRRAASNGEHVAEEVVPRVGVLDRSGDVWNLAVIAHAPR